MVFELYALKHLSINAIARLLNQRGIPTRTGKTRWERSTVWGTAQSGIPGQGLLRKDGTTTTPAHHSATATAE